MAQNYAPILTDPLSNLAGLTSIYASYKYTYRVNSVRNGYRLKIVIGNVSTEEQAEARIKQMLTSGVLASLGTKDPEELTFELLKVET